MACGSSVRASAERAGFAAELPSLSSCIAGGTPQPFPADEGGCSAPRERRERGLHPHTSPPQLTLAWLGRC